MGFLDSLEGDLKNLESAAERDPAEIARREALRAQERAAALAAQPWADQLRTSAFTADLLNHTALLGRARRIPVRIAWLGTTLRLQARDHSLELKPTPSGISGHFLRGQAEIESFPVSLSSSAEELARRWLSVAADTP